MERILSEKFENDLLNGCLKGLWEHILADNTLMLAVRDGYVNVYYRGGNILKLSEKGDGYDASFDPKYTEGLSSRFQLPLPNSPKRIVSETEVKQWVESFPVRKQIMDFFFTSKVEKLEREFQQLVVRENNFSRISNATDYFIADIEFDIELPESKKKAQLDMLAFKWLRESAIRKKDDGELALIEMKYGDGNLEKESGIIAHLRQFDELICDPVSRKKLRETVEKQMNQLNKLELINHSRMENRKFTVTDGRIEVIFMFANHDPRSGNQRSGKLLEVLETKEFSSLVAKMEDYCDVRFFIANSAGYGMHEKCMVNLKNYIEFLKRDVKEFER